MEKDAPDISVLVECLRAHFQMEVVVGSRVAGEDFEAIEKAGGCDAIQDIKCGATNMEALSAYRAQAGSSPSVKRALECLEQRCGL